MVVDKKWSSRMVGTVLRKAAVLVVLLSIPGILSAQSMTFPTNAPFTSPPLIKTTTGAGNSINVSGYPTGPSLNLHYWTMVWFAVGTVSTGQCKAEKSVDNVTWTDLIAATACTTTGWTTTSAAADTNYVRLNITTKSGSGTVLLTLNGWTQNPYGTVAVSGTITPGGTQDVNVKQVNGGTVNTGNGTASGSERVSIPSDNTPFGIISNSTGSFVTDVVTSLGMVAITSGTTTSWGTTTEQTTYSTCTNTTASNILINAMDGAGNYILKNATIVANSMLPSNWAYGLVWLNGIKVSTNTSTGVNCQFNGKTQ